MACEPMHLIKTFTSTGSEQLHPKQSAQDIGNWRLLRERERGGDMALELYKTKRWSPPGKKSISKKNHLHYQKPESSSKCSFLPHSLLSFWLDCPKLLLLPPMQPRRFPHQLHPLSFLLNQRLHRRTIPQL